MDTNPFESPQADLSPTKCDSHKSFLRIRDIVVGTFFTQISMTINKVAYVFFALFFAHEEWKQVFDSIDQFSALLFVYLFFFYLLLILIFVGVFGAFISLFQSLGKKGVLGAHEFEFRDDEFVEKTPFNESIHKYQSINRVFKRLGSIYIGMPGAQWHILPKRDFASSEDRDNLFTFLKTMNGA